MSSEISIKQLPLITEINGNDLLLVQTQNETNTLLFSDFVVGLDNTTFGNTIVTNTSRLNTLSTIVDGILSGVTITNVGSSFPALSATTFFADRIEVDDLITLGTGTPEISSATEILLTAGTRVDVLSSPLKMAQFTTSQRDTIVAENGDLIYNTTIQAFQGYQANAWVTLLSS